MKHLSLYPVTERCQKAVVMTKQGTYTLMTSNADLISRTNKGESKAKRKLIRLTLAYGDFNPNELPERNRIGLAVPIIAVLYLYLSAYSNDCDTKQFMGYIVGFVALIGLVTILYLNSEIKR